MEEFSRGSGGVGGGSAAGDSMNLMNSKVGFLRGDSYGNQSPGITITSDTVQVEIKFRQRVDENRGKYNNFSNNMEQAINIVPEMKTKQRNINNCKEQIENEEIDGEYGFCRVDVGSIDCATDVDDGEQRQSQENNQFSYEKYQFDDDTYRSQTQDELIMMGRRGGGLGEAFNNNCDDEDEKKRRTDSYAIFMPQQRQDNPDAEMMSPSDTVNAFANGKFIIIDRNTNSSSTSTISIPTPDPVVQEKQQQVNSDEDKADTKLDDLVKKILKCDLCPQATLTNFNESFAHHQHHHGLKFCPVCFQLVNCHDEFVQEHLKSSHLINDEGDVNCPICSIPIHHILCFDHIKKDHLRGYYEQLDTKPVVRQINNLPTVINPPELFKIPLARLGQNPVSHNEEGAVSKLGSNNAEHREPSMHAAVSFTNRVDGLNRKNESSRHPEVNNRNKITRNKLNNHQIEILDAYFERNKHPSLVDRLELARTCNLPIATITAWFGNRRRLRIDWEKASDHQKKRLLSSYEQNSRPSHAEIDKLCSELNFNHTQVSSWFKTRSLAFQNLRKRQKPNSHLRLVSAKRRVTEMLKAKLASSDSDSMVSNAVDVGKATTQCLDPQMENNVLPVFELNQVCNSQSLGVDEKLIKVQDWINHIVESSIRPDPPDGFLETNQEERTRTDIETRSKRLEENQSSKDRITSRSPSPPVLTRPCTPPFHQRNFQSTESAQIRRSLSPVAPVLTVQTSADHQTLKVKMLLPGKQFSFETKQMLREYFKTIQYLSDKEKKSLAEKVGTTRQRISNWFQLERSHLKSFLSGCKDVNSQVRNELLAKHRRMENINLQDIYDKFVNFFTRGNYFTNSQEMKLIKKFAEDMHPNTTQISVIAKEVGASKEKVSQWFTNRFQRLRRGKLPGYDLKGGMLIRLGTDTMYSEIKIEPPDVSSNNQPIIRAHSPKREARPAVPTLQWSRSKELPLNAVIKQEFPTEPRNSNPIFFLDKKKVLIVRARNLPISPGTIIKVKDSELDMFERTFRPATMTDSDAHNDPSISKAPSLSETSGNHRASRKERNHYARETISSGNSRQSSNPRHFSPYQKQSLEELYAKNNFPTNRELKILADKLSLSELQVNRWFTYKRFMVKNKARDERRKQLSNSATLRKLTRRPRRSSAEIREPITPSRPLRKTVTNRCTGFLQCQRDILWESFGKCDNPNQEEMHKLAETTGLTAIQVDQWFRQQRYKKRHGKGVFAFHRGPRTTCKPASSPVDIKPAVQDIKEVDLVHSSTADGNREPPNSPVKRGRGRPRRITPANQADCTNMNPASLVKIEMRADTDSESPQPSSSRPNASVELVNLNKLPPPVQKSREHSAYRRTYSRGKVQQGDDSQPHSSGSDSSSSQSQPQEEKLSTRILTYLGTEIPLPLNLLNRFKSIRAMNLATFQATISKLSLKFDELVETYVLSDDDCKNWILEETKTLKNIIELHEKSSIVFTCEQEDILIERRLNILNALLKKRPTDSEWCSTVNSFHLENVFRSWYFLGVYCILNSMSLGDGIADFSSQLSAIPNGPTSPATWLIPPVLEEP